MYVVIVQVDKLIEWVKNAFYCLAMTDYPYPASFLGPLPAYPVNASCHSLLSEPNRLRGLAQAAGMYHSYAQSWNLGPIH